MPVEQIGPAPLAAMQSRASRFGIPLAQLLLDTTDFFAILLAVRAPAASADRLIPSSGAFAGSRRDGPVQLGPLLQIDRRKLLQLQRSNRCARQRAIGIVDPTLCIDR